MSESIERRAAQWIARGDTGMSSKALWAAMMGVKSDGSHPLDPGDFGRCYRLLETVPEWKGRLSELTVLSPYWAALVPEWDKITESYLREVPDGARDFHGRAEATYKLMKSILDPITDKDRNVVRFGSGMTARFR